MNRVSINLLCAVILIIISFGIIGFGNTFFHGIADGFSSKEIVSESDYPVLANLNNVSNMSGMATSSVDSIGAGNHKYAIIHETAVVLVKESDFPQYLKVLSIIFPLVGICLLVWLITEFIRFIININRGYIFERRNVRYLKKIGFILISIACAGIGSGIVDDIILRCLNLKQSGLSLSGEWTMPWTNILVGLVALLMSKIWDSGIKMREEQELTI